MAKLKLFKFRDGLKEVKVGDSVWEVSHNRGQLGGPKFVQKLGNKLMTVGHVNLPEVERDMYDRCTSQYYSETGRVKSEYTHGVSIYSSEAAYRRTIEEQVTIDKCARLFGGYTTPRDLTYDKACRILKIMEET